MNLILIHLKFIFPTSFLTIPLLTENLEIHHLPPCELEFSKVIWIICLPSSVNHSRGRILVQVKSFLPHRIRIPELIEYRISTESHFYKYFLKNPMLTYNFRLHSESFLQYFFKLSASFQYTLFMFSFIYILCQLTTLKVSLNQFHYSHFCSHDILWVIHSRHQKAYEAIFSISTISLPQEF